MILRIERFGCLSGFSLDLNQWTVLTGRGRTTFFRALLHAALGRGEVNVEGAWLERADGSRVEAGELPGNLPYLIPTGVPLRPGSQKALASILSDDLPEPGWRVLERAKSRLGAPEVALLEGWGPGLDAKTDSDTVRYWRECLEKYEKRERRDLEAAMSYAVPMFEGIPDAQLDRDCELYAGKLDVVSAQLRDLDHEVLQFYGELHSPRHDWSEEEADAVRAKIRAHHETMDRLRKRRGEMSEAIRARRAEKYRREREVEARVAAAAALDLLESYAAIRRFLESDAQYGEGRAILKLEARILELWREARGPEVILTGAGEYRFGGVCGVSGLSHSEAFLWETCVRMAYAEAVGFPWMLVDIHTTLPPRLSSPKPSFVGAVVGSPVSIGLTKSPVGGWREVCLDATR